MTPQTITALATALTSIIGAVTTAIWAIRSHERTANAVINAQQPIGPTAPTTVSPQQPSSGGSPS